MIATYRKVLLVGAGPGDPELITVKGLKAISMADVVLYDALVSQELLSYCSKSCKLVNVGKRRGRQEFTQEQINDLLVFYACRYGNVVRLKGGDPYVFGRGHEEMEYLSKRGIKVEVIPGISSAIAAPSAAGIAVTKRGINESFWVITGTTSSGALSEDFSLAARSSATLVVLMGMAHLETIVDIVRLHRGESEPVAIIQNATLPSQRTVCSPLFEIVQKVRAQHIGTPAVIVIGNVCEERLLSEIVKLEPAKVKVAV